MYWRRFLLSLKG